MRLKSFLSNACIILALTLSIVFLQTEMSYAKSMTLKVSHQFAAGDVRDQMGRVFGAMVTEKTNGEIKFRHYPAKSLFKPKEHVCFPPGLCIRQGTPAVHYINALFGGQHPTGTHLAKQADRKKN
jgi:hypothetical protein